MAKKLRKAAKKKVTKKTVTKSETSYKVVITYFTDSWDPCGRWDKKTVIKVFDKKSDAKKLFSEIKKTEHWKDTSRESTIDGVGRVGFTFRRIKEAYVESKVITKIESFRVGW